jgi:RNA polymerase sigma-70 factor (ECF subfamily)
LEINELIQLALNGNQNAYKSLLDKHWNEVYFFMLKRSENETEAEDITIETFSKAFEKLESYNSDYQFNTWLISIAKNLYVDYLRKKKVQQFVDLDDEEKMKFFEVIDDSPTLEDQLIIEQNLANLLIYIKQLKPHYQEVIQLRYFQEMSYNDIATHLNEPLSNVKIKLLRAKNLLAEVIKKSR